MKILALDASTEACSLALYNDGEVVQRFQHRPQQQARLLLPECDALLADAGIVLSQIDAIAFCNGPGSFTGLRVATAAAQGTAVAYDLPLIPVSTLLTMAYGEYRRSQRSNIAVCLDARMQEVYFASYQLTDNSRKTLSKDAVLAPKDVKLIENQADWSFVGNGWTVYREQFTFSVPTSEQHYWPEAQDLLCIALHEYKQGHLFTPEQALPVYIRDNVAIKKTTSF